MNEFKLVVHGMCHVTSRRQLANQLQPDQKAFGYFASRRSLLYVAGILINPAGVQTQVSGINVVPTVRIFTP